MFVCEALLILLAQSFVVEALTCKDDATWCTNYKSHCDSNTYVAQHCVKTCGKCPVPNQECSDISTNCKTYQSACYQNNYISYMQKNCQLSCKYCSSGDCGVANLREKRESGLASGIVQGDNAPVGYYPWQVAIMYDGDLLCGGSLIDSKHVLSAAHCFEPLDITDLSKFQVVLGDNNIDVTEGTEQKLGVSKITVHENYKPGILKNDITLMKLSGEAKVSRFINTICLPEHKEELKVGRKCFVTGWGKMYVASPTSAQLLQVDLPIASRADCAKRNSFNGHVITSDMICAGYNNGLTFKSACHGDSGGPLQCEDEKTGKWTLYGVVSWGNPQCNGLESYTVFTRVSNYIGWIYKNKNS